ncbi:MULTISPECIES: 3'-5' exonuclease [Chitinophagaceae]
MADNRRFAIVDLETTGSPASSNGITEIAIVLHDGKRIEGKYETLINPGMPIPPYVAHLTNISNEMVAVAPDFGDVADEIYKILDGRVFVAHNVNFDYPFLQHFFTRQGINFQANKLCTLKLTRKAFPSFERYGLDYLCKVMEIDLLNRHRAGGDAYATAVIFDKIINNGGGKLIDALTENFVSKPLPVHQPFHQRQLVLKRKKV